MSKKARADWWADGDDNIPSPTGAQAPAPVAVAARSVLADVRARALNAGTRDGSMNDNAKRVAELTDSFEAYLRMHELVSSNTLLPASQGVPLIDIAPNNTAYEPAALPLSNLFPLSGSFNNSLSLSDLLSGRIEAALAASIQRDQLQLQQQQQFMQLTPAQASIANSVNHVTAPPSVAPPAAAAPVANVIMTNLPPPFSTPVMQCRLSPSLLSVGTLGTPPVITPNPLESPAFLKDLPAHSDLARLAIVGQPGPKSLWKKRLSVPPFAVRVLAAPGVQLKECGPIRAYLVSDSPDRIEVENASIKPEPGMGNTATFTNLRFNKGSHQHLAHLYFECQIVSSDGRIATLTSPPSEPFIVCTNISQWLSSEKKVFKRVCFGDEGSVAYHPTFRSHLEAHFTRAVSSYRSMHPDDVAYIHEHQLAGKQRISQEEFEVFWAWYGPALKEVYEKAGHARLLWERYWLFGFMPEQNARNYLQNSPPGTFILAFSATTPVIFAKIETGFVTIDPKGPVREAMIEHQQLTTLLCMSGDGELHTIAKAAVIKGLRRRKENDTVLL